MAAKKKASARKTSKATNDKVGKVMHERKKGTLRSGSSGKKVTSKKQAIAIGLSEARREGKKVPPNPNAKKSAARKSPAKKRASSAKKRAAKSTTARTRTAKKQPA